MKLLTQSINNCSATFGLMAKESRSYSASIPEADCAQPDDDFLVSPVDVDDRDFLTFFDFVSPLHPTSPNVGARTSPTLTLEAPPVFHTNLWDEKKFLSRPSVVSSRPTVDKRTVEIDGNKTLALSQASLLAWCLRPGLGSFEQSERAAMAAQIGQSGGISFDIACPTQDKIVINGDLDLSALNSLRHLPDFLHVKGDLILLGMAQLTCLPEGLKVEGSLIAEGCPQLVNLSKETFVGQRLNLAHCSELYTLPPCLIVRGDLDLSCCTGLTSLPKGIKVGRDLTTKGCRKLSRIELDFRKLRNANLSDCEALRDLPGEIDLDGSLILTGCSQVRQLSQTLTVGGSLVLENCRALRVLTSIEAVLSEQIGPDPYRQSVLRSGVKIGGDLILTGCSALTKLSFGLSVGRNLLMNGCTALESLPQQISVGGLLSTFACPRLTACLADFREVGGVKLFTLLPGKDTSCRKNISDLIFSSRIDECLERKNLCDMQKMRRALNLFTRPVPLSEENFATYLDICASTGIRDQDSFFAVARTLSSQYSLNEDDWLANIQSMSGARSRQRQDRAIACTAGPFGVMQFTRHFDDPPSALSSVGFSRPTQTAIQNFWRLRTLYFDQTFAHEINSFLDFLN